MTAPITYYDQYGWQLTLQTIEPAPPGTAGLPDDAPQYPITVGTYFPPFQQAPMMPIIAPYPEPNPPSLPTPFNLYEPEPDPSLSSLPSREEISRKPEEEVSKKEFTRRFWMISLGGGDLGGWLTQQLRGKEVSGENPRPGFRLKGVQFPKEWVEVKDPLEFYRLGILHYHNFKQVPCRNHPCLNHPTCSFLHPGDPVFSIRFNALNEIDSVRVVEIHHLHGQTKVGTLGSEFYEQRASLTKEHKWHKVFEEARRVDRLAKPILEEYCFRDGCDDCNRAHNVISFIAHNLSRRPEIALVNTCAYGALANCPWGASCLDQHEEEIEPILSSIRSRNSFLRRRIEMTRKGTWAENLKKGEELYRIDPARDEVRLELCHVRGCRDEGSRCMSCHDVGEYFARVALGTGRGYLEKRCSYETLEECPEGPACLDAHKGEPLQEELRRS